MPALPLDEAGKYVAGAYVVFLTLVVVYVAIIGAKIARIEHELEELNELVDEGGRSPTVHDGPEARRSDQIAGLSAGPPDTAPRR
jgi:type II secretory pathway component PulM